MSKKSIINALAGLTITAPINGAEALKNVVDRLNLGRRRQDRVPDDYIIQKNDFGIRMAGLRHRLDKVEMLVTRMYSQRGYKTASNNIGTSELPSNLRRVTLEACRHGTTVGTITVALDGPEGLNAEDLYRDEIKPYRAAGARICEFTRLALDVDQCGKEALGSLFHLAVIFAYKIHSATDLFIEVNPRHSIFYRRKLGFEVIGKEKVCRRVEAPAVLLHQKLSSISEQIIRYGGLKLQENKSFYSFFMPPWEERELIAEIRTLLARTETPPLQADTAAV